MLSVKHRLTRSEHTNDHQFIATECILFATPGYELPRLPHRQGRHFDRSVGPSSREIELATDYLLSKIDALITG